MSRMIFLSFFLTLLLASCTSTPTPTRIAMPIMTPTITEEVKIDDAPTESSSNISETPTFAVPSHIPTIIVTQEPEVGIMGENEAIRLAEETLSESLNVDLDQIEVVFVTKIDWPDASLGCPQKGMFYAQVIIPGYKVILKVDEDQYDIHVGEGHAVICVSGQPLGETIPDIDISAAVRMSKLAQQDLARRLEVSEEDIKVNWIKPKTWTDTSLGCPEPGKDYTQVETQGYQIELEYQGDRYTYHTDMENEILCDSP